MPKKKVIKPQVEEVKSSKTEFKVFDAKGNFVRDYKVETSGEKAGEMAEVFAKEIGGIIK